MNIPTPASQPSPTCEHKRQATTALGALTNTGWKCKDCGELTSKAPAPDQQSAARSDQPHNAEQERRDIEEVLRETFPARSDKDAEWLPTAENVNALPEGVRRFVHDLATRCDPAGDVAALTGLRDQLDGVQIMYHKAACALEEVRGCFRAAEVEGLSAALAETTDEHLKDLVERRLMYALYAAQGTPRSQSSRGAPSIDETDWREKCAAVIDIWDDAQSNPPEDRCYTEGAWPDLLNEIRAALARRATAGNAAPLADALRNIRDYRTDVSAEIAARSMRFYAEQALAGNAAPTEQVQK